MGQARSAGLGGLEVLLAAADEMAADARLVGGQLEPPIGGPAVADQCPVKIGTHDGPGLIEATSLHDPIDRDVARDDDPQPCQLAADLPARLVARGHSGALDLLDEGVVGGGEGIGHAVCDLTESATSHGEREVRAEDAGELAEGHADMLAEVGDEGLGSRAEMDVRRPDGIAGLWGVAPLNPPAAASAAAHTD